MLKRLVILVPTYNEKDSIAGLLQKLKDFREGEKIDFDLLIIDDNSPDGTADLVEGLQFSWVQVLRRPTKDGLGAAYRSGFGKVLSDETYSHILTMDADGSHRVEDLKAMIDSIKPGRSITLGTRWMAGGGVRAGTRIGATDELGLMAVERPVQFRDLHATILTALGIDYDRLSFSVNGRDERITGVAGSPQPLMDILI